MKIGFYFVEEGKPLYTTLAQIMICSAHAVMPGVEVVQFTDETSPQVYGADTVIRKKKQVLNLMRCTHFMDAEGDWLLVDSDVYFQGDVRNVFNKPFDIGLTDRNYQGGGILDGMTSNVGVVFSRSRGFWIEVKQWLMDHPEHINDWYGDQRAICQVANRIKWNVRTLPGLVYNYPPLNMGDPATESQIVHCKGGRKEWMIHKHASSGRTVCV